jgi:FlaA1/EpsC-like NDP-sugar epimerase
MLLLVDLFLIIVAALGSFALRTDLGPLFSYYLPQAIWLVAISILVKPVVFYFFGLYRRVWIYASTQELKIIVVAVTTASVIVSLMLHIIHAVRCLLIGS